MLILYIFLLFFIACFNNADYPTEIIDNKLETKYDKAKWILYELNTNYNNKEVFTPNSTILNGKTDIDKIPFISWNLDFFGKSIVDDTVKISFYYRDDDGHMITPNTKYSFHVVGFIKDSVHMISAGDVYFEYEGLKNNYKPSDFEEVLKENSSKLDPWLFREAKKRGIL